VKRWRYSAPEGFIYAIKVPRIITHVKKLKEVKTLLEDLKERLFVLKELLGVVLFQMPPNFHNTKENLNRIKRLKNLNIRIAVEFRHKSWFVEEIYEELQRESLIPVTVYAAEEGIRPIWPKKGLLYLRFHGTKGWYIGEYGEAFLKGIGERIKKEKRSGFAYFNNDVDAAAVRDALCLKNICGV